MKRFHVHLHVDDLNRSVSFYSQLFAAQPARVEADYAKWMLEDPPVNFAISARGNRPGIDHLGIQTDDADELAELKARAQAADMTLLDEGATTCCYARSEKHWITDPQGVAWEHFHTLGSIPMFNEARSPHRYAPRRAARPATKSTRPPRSAPLPAAEIAMTAETSYNALFICTGNSARSILAEGILNGLGKGRFHAYSAGSYPKGRVHPLTLITLERLQLPTTGYRSKSWDEFVAPGAPVFDFIFTVCDNAAGEVCPVWPGKPVSAHWGVPDPAAVVGSEEQQRKAFLDAALTLRRRNELLLSLPLPRLEGMSLQHELRAIGTQ
jgi:protein-tyrosine-phosphatase